MDENNLHERKSSRRRVLWGLVMVLVVGAFLLFGGRSFFQASPVPTKFTITSTLLTVTGLPTSVSLNLLPKATVSAPNCLAMETATPPPTITPTPAYDAVPVRASDRQAFLDFRRKQFPWVKNWDALLAATQNPEMPAGENAMPNFTAAWARIAAFGERIESVDNLDLAAEESALVDDLTALFNK